MTNSLKIRKKIFEFFFHTILVKKRIFDPERQKI